MRLSDGSCRSFTKPRSVTSRSPHSTRKRASCA
nr:MAG TPA: hypothetical protein [Caudoviricetes sp.]